MTVETGARLHHVIELHHKVGQRIVAEQGISGMLMMLRKAYPEFDLVAISAEWQELPERQCHVYGTKGDLYIKWRNDKWEAGDYER